jgi:hypothetical protein
MMSSIFVKRVFSAVYGIAGVIASGSAIAGCPIGSCFDVLTFVDRIDSNAGDGICQTPPTAIGGEPGPCSLRAAIMEANALEAANPANGPYTIRLAEGTYSLTRPSISVPDFEGSAGSLNIFADGVSISGPGEGTYAVIRGSDTFAGRLMHVSGAHNLLVRDVEFTAAEHGMACSRAGSAPDAGSVSLSRVRMHHLIAPQAPDGGAISSPSDCQWEIADSEFWANQSGGGRGSAIYIGKNGFMKAMRTGLIGNGDPEVIPTAEGTALFATSANVILENVTVAGNIAGSYGSVAMRGDLFEGPYSLSMRNVTIARNATNESSGTAGLFLRYGEANLNNSVVADNPGGSGDLLLDLDADFFSGGYNVLGPISPESGQHTLSLLSTDRIDRSNVGLGAVPTSLPALIGVSGLLPTLTGLLLNQGDPAPFSDVSGEGACLVLDASGRKRRAAGRCDIGAMENFPNPWAFHAVQLADAVDGDPGDGVCSTIVLPGAPNAATCTLRAAVMESAWLHTDGHMGLFKVNLVPGNHDLSIGDAGDSDPASGDLDVQGFELAVRGDQPLWQMASTIRATSGFPDRLFHVMYEATETDTRLELHNAVLADANIQTDRGAGVNCISARLEVTGSRFRDLKAMIGSAVSVIGCATVIADSDIANNESAPFCGAVYNLSSDLEITRSTLRGNFAGEHGSAMCDDSVNGGGQTRLTAVTISGNHGVADNAAVYLNGNSSLRNVSVTGNTAEAGATDLGALRITDPNVNLTLHNSAVSGNGGGSDLYIEPGASVTESNNLIGTLTPGSSPLPNSTPGQLSGVGALTQLSDTGLSWGHIPVPGGSAHNTGNAGPGFSDDPASPLCARYDHSYRDRGLDPDHHCDIGAVEYFAVPPPPIDLDTIFKDDFEVF